MEEQILDRYLERIRTVKEFFRITAAEILATSVIVLMIYVIIFLILSIIDTYNENGSIREEQKVVAFVKAREEESRAVNQVLDIDYSIGNIHRKATDRHTTMRHSLNSADSQGMLDDITYQQELNLYKDSAIALFNETEASLQTARVERNVEAVYAFLDGIVAFTKSHKYSDDREIIARGYARELTRADIPETAITTFRDDFDDHPLVLFVIWTLISTATIGVYVVSIRQSYRMATWARVFTFPYLWNYAVVYTLFAPGWALLALFGFAVRNLNSPGNRLIENNSYPEDVMRQTILEYGEQSGAGHPVREEPKYVLEASAASQLKLAQAGIAFSAIEIQDSIRIRGIVIAANDIEQTLNILELDFFNFEAKRTNEPYYLLRNQEWTISQHLSDLRTNAVQSSEQFVQWCHGRVQARLEELNILSRDKKEKIDSTNREILERQRNLIDLEQELKNLVQEVSELKESTVSDFNFHAEFEKFCNMEKIQAVRIDGDAMTVLTESIEHYGGTVGPVLFTLHLNRFNNGDHDVDSPLVEMYPVFPETSIGIQTQERRPESGWYCLGNALEIIKDFVGHFRFVEAAQVVIRFCEQG